MMLWHKKRAFTIIELMVVVFIIGVLATIAIVTLERGKIKSRDAKRKSDLALIASAFERYRADKKVYPKNSTLVAPPVCDLGTTNCPIETINEYLYPLPTDPASVNKYKLKSNGQSYKVTILSEGIVEIDSGNGCAGTTATSIAIKQKAGDYCDPVDERRFQVSSDKTATETW